MRLQLYNMQLQNNFTPFMKICIHFFIISVCFMNEFWGTIHCTFFFVLGYWYWVLKQNQETYVGQRKISWPFWKLETIKSFLIKFEYADGNMKSTSLLVNLFQRVDFIDRYLIAQCGNYRILLPPICPKIPWK